MSSFRVMFCSPTADSNSIRQGLQTEEVTLNKANTASDSTRDLEKNEFTQVQRVKAEQENPTRSNPFH